MKILEVRDLAISFEEKIAVDKINFDLSAG